jgi:hypothetical protein
MTWVLVAILMMQSVVLSDILTPFSEEERDKLDILLTNQLASNQDDDLFVMAKALNVLNSSTVFKNRTRLCQLADKKMKIDSLRCPDGLNAAAILGCELSDIYRANLRQVLEVQIKMLDEKNLKSIHCATETLLLLKMSFDKNVAAYVHVNVIASKVRFMLKSDNTFAEEGNEPAVAINAGYAIKSLANLALIDPDRFVPQTVRPVMDKREEILLQIADSAIDDPSLQPLSLALQVAFGIPFTSMSPLLSPACHPASTATTMHSPASTPPVTNHSQPHPHPTI